MGDREGGESFGFAPRGPQVRRDAVETSRPTPSRQPGPHPTRAPGPQTYDHERSEKSVWLWLGIGILLGTGATLLSSSFWLPKSSDLDLVNLETGEQMTISPGVASANEATPSVTSAEEELAPKPPVADASSSFDRSPTTAEAKPVSPPDGGEEAELETRLVALDVDDAVVQPPVNGAGQSDAADQDTVPTAETSQDQVSGVADTKPSEPATTTERLLPADDVDIEAFDDIQVSELDPGTAEAEGPPAALSNAPTRPEEPVASQADANEPETEERPEVISVAAEIERDPPTSAADIETSEPLNGKDVAALTPSVTSNPPPPSSSSSSAAGSGRLYRVQLAAVANETAAEVYWREVNERLPGVFSDVEPVFDERVVDSRLYLRIWVGSFGRRIEADTYCGWLKEQGQDCFVTRVDNL